MSSERLDRSFIPKSSFPLGPPVTLAAASLIGSLSWGSDDRIVYGETGKGFMRISANGGNPEVILKEENELILHPQILPDGKSVLYNRVDTRPRKIMVQSKSGERKELLAGDTAGYLSTGHIAYAVENALFAIPFDPDKLAVTGGPVPMVLGIFQSATLQYAISAASRIDD
jgi:hypothetical protein